MPRRRPAREHDDRVDQWAQSMIDGTLSGTVKLAKPTASALRPAIAGPGGGSIPFQGRVGGGGECLALAVGFLSIPVGGAEIGWDAYDPDRLSTGFVGTEVPNAIPILNGLRGYFDLHLEDVRWLDGWRLWQTVEIRTNGSTMKSYGPARGILDGVVPLGTIDPIETRIFVDHGDTVPHDLAGGMVMQLVEPPALAAATPPPGPVCIQLAFARSPVSAWNPTGFSDSAACWIWDQPLVSGSHPSGATASFSKALSLGASTPTTIELSADNYAQVYVNGTMVLEQTDDKGFGSRVSAAVTLPAGTSTIRLDGQNLASSRGGNPAGILASIRRDSDSAVLARTDATWTIV